MKIVPITNHNYTLQLLLDELEKHKFNKNWNYRKIGKWSIRWSIKFYAWVVKFGSKELFLNEIEYYYNPSEYLKRSNLEQVISSYFIPKELV